MATCYNDALTLTVMVKSVTDHSCVLDVQEPVPVEIPMSEEFSRETSVAEYEANHILFLIHVTII